jgi:hypothetical protein
MVQPRMSSRGRPALVVAFTRTNEWLTVKEELFINTPSSNWIELPDTSSDEAGPLAQHLSRLRVADSAPVLSIVEAEGPKFRSFFELLYSLVEPARPMLERKVQEEYDHLAGLAQKAYETICALYRYGVPINIEWLVRSLACT